MRGFRSLQRRGCTVEQARLEVFRKLLMDRREALVRESASAPGREQWLVQKIDEALLRFDDGTYGTCEACGVAIDERRLMARPVATHCIDCKTEADTLEGRRRAF